MKELFEKVYIHSEADLPKVAGDYFVCHYGNGKGNKDYYPFSKIGHFENIYYWTNHIEWYLQPIHDQREPIQEKTEDQTLLNDIEEFVSIYMKSVGSVDKKNIIEHDLREGITIGLILAKKHATPSTTEKKEDWDKIKSDFTLWARAKWCPTHEQIFEWFETRLSAQFHPAASDLREELIKYTDFVWKYIGQNYFDRLDSVDVVDKWLRDNKIK